MPTRQLWPMLFAVVLAACGAQPPATGVRLGATNIASSPPASPAPSAPAGASATPANEVSARPGSTVQPSAAETGPSESTNEKGEHVLGRPNAPITIIDYSDFL